MRISMGSASRNEPEETLIHCSKSSRADACPPPELRLYFYQFKLSDTQRGDIAHQGHRMDQQKISYSLCLNLLTDPVTTTCGHSNCRTCVKNHWDTEEQRMVYSCPQCKESFTPRPVLKKNTMLADLVEDLKKTGLQAAPADHCYAGPEDVACDVCTGRKVKAQESCLQCLASFCEEHLQPHFHAAPFKKHKPVEPSKKLQENIYSVHDEVMKMFCRTDQQSICYLCPVDKHRGHDTVSAAVERTERQRELQGSQLNIQQRIQDRERDVMLLQQQVEAINSTADEAVENSEKIFTELIRLLEQRGSEVKQQLRSRQQTDVSRVRELQEKLEQEITELKRKEGELEKLSLTQDHSQFLQDYPLVSQIREPKDSSNISEHPLVNFKGVTAALSELRGKLKDVLRGTWTKISETETQVDVLLPEPEPRTRAEFFRYSQDITLDPNTVHRQLLLSDGNRKGTVLRKAQPYPDHPERFTGYYFQVLSKESLTGRCYWEVELRGEVSVPVSYKTIRRDGTSLECLFGQNNKSWLLVCLTDSYVFVYNKINTPVLGPVSSRVGVYLDHRAGILSFYSVSKTMTLLRRVQTTFTEPLHTGLGFPLTVGSSAEFCKLN